MRKTVRQCVREWFCALVCYSVLIAPFGCELRAPLDDLDPGPSDVNVSVGSSGLFINQNLDEPLIMGARGPDDDKFYVFGTRNAAGTLEEVESIAVETAAGESSFVSFESGRPVHAEAADGSYAHITYAEVTSDRLTADVELFDANTAAKQFFTVDVDLARAAEQIADVVAQVTGRDLETTEVADLDAKAVASAQYRVTITSPLFVAFVLPFVALVAFMTVVLGQILLFVYQAVVLAIHAVVLAIFAPLFIIADVLGSVVFNVTFLPLDLVFEVLPPPPIVILA